jgi:cellulose synthase/poly-beta-1,6-N-acetylglucosamine synthase-like glycosyltransferase
MISVLVGSFGDPLYHELAADACVSANVALAALKASCELIAEHDDGGTLAGVRNRLAADARGPWLCFLDADDELCPDYLAVMAEAVQALPGGSLALLAPAVQYCDRGRPLGPARIPNLGLWPGTNECVIGTLVQRDLFLEVGGFRELPSLEDYDLWLRCVRAGARIVHVPDAVYVAHAGPAGRNADQSTYWRLREEHADLFA